MKPQRNALLPAIAALGGLALTLPLAAAQSPGARPAAPAPPVVRDPQITPADITAHVKYLASEGLEGRGSGTRGNDLAADYMAARFRAAGLKPAGESGTYFQGFSVFAGTSLGKNNALEIRSGGTATSVAAGTDMVPLGLAKNGTVTAPLVFAGYGISQPELGYDDYKDLDVKGKIVVVLRYTPDGDEGGKFGPHAPLGRKVMTAREKGAAGILFVTGPMSATEEVIPRVTYGAAATDAGLPAAFVRRRYVEALLEPLKLTLNDLQVTMAHGQPKSFPISGAEATLTVDVNRQTARTRNVLGLLEGSDPKLKREVVVVGAHFDHLGHGGEHSLEPASGPKIHYGADDNASGTAGVLELAQYFAANRQKLGRSLLFMGFSGEEIGLIGSGYWTKKPTIPLDRVVAMLNMDMIGRMRNDTCYVIGSGTSPEWAGLLEAVNKPYALSLKGSGSALSGFGGSDQQSFYARDIPVLFFFTGSHKDYHRSTDTWDKINYPGTAKLVRLVGDTALRISRMPARPRFARAPEPAAQPSTSFRVYLGTIPDYAEDVEGVALQGAREGSPAEKAGVKPGDILVELDGKKVKNVQEYTYLLGSIKPNVPIKMVVLRKGQRVELEVTPAPRR